VKYKFTTLLFLAGIVYTNAFAQPTIKAQKTIGGNTEDMFTSMYLTKDGGLIAGGYSGSNKSGEKTENSRGGSDYWVVKLDRLGKIQWDKTIGGNSSDELSSLQQTSDGGYILGGGSSSDISGEKTENSRGDEEYDYWAVKLDSFGNIQWDKTIGGNNLDEITSLQQTSDGGYILGGYSSSDKSGEKTQNSSGTYDYWVVKLNSLGNIQWDKTIGGSGYDFLTSLQQTGDGGYILGGYSSSDKSGEKTHNSRGTYDYWVVKLNSLGNIQWDKTIGGSGYDFLAALQETSDGGYILGGSSYSNKSGEKTENNRGKQLARDYWVVKLNEHGKIHWDKTIGGNDHDGLLSLQQTSDGGYILSGFSYSNKSGEKTENSRGGADYWVVKLDSLENIQWDKTIGGSDYESLYSIDEIEKNRFVLGGYSYSGVSGDKTQRSRGATDFWLVKLKYETQCPKDISSSETANSIARLGSNKNFMVYPNPAKNILHIQTNGKAIVSLIDHAGKILLTKTIDGNGIINIADLAPGLYYLKNTTTGATEKIIITK